MERERVCAELSGVIRIPVTVRPFTGQRKREMGNEGGREKVSGEEEN